MNSDIRLSVGFWQHPKVRKLEKRLGLKGVRSLQILWCWCAQNRPGGTLAGMDAEDIELAADWRGKAGAFFEQCLGVWIDESDGAYQLHEWEIYNPWQAASGEKAEAYREKKRKAAMARWGKRAETEASGDMQNDAPAMQSDADCNAQSMQVDMQNDAPAMQNDATLTYTNTRNIKGNFKPPYPQEGGCEPEKPPQSSHKKQTGNSLPELQAQMRDYTDNPALLKTLEDYRLMRERIRKPMTGRAFEILLVKLSELAVDDATKIAILEQSILNSWQGIFPLKQDARASPDKPATPTEYQKCKQEQREMAKMLYEARQARKQLEA